MFDVVVIGQGRRIWHHKGTQLGGKVALAKVPEWEAPAGQRVYPYQGISAFCINVPERPQRA